MVPVLPSGKKRRRSTRLYLPPRHDNGDEHITVGFAPPQGAINVAATPIGIPQYFLKLHNRGPTIMIIHNQDRQSVVILSAAKDLPSERSFAALRMTGPILIVKIIIGIPAPRQGAYAPMKM